MKLRIFLGSVAMGILATFVGFAFSWTYSAVTPEVFGMVGSTSTIVMGVHDTHSGNLAAHEQAADKLGNFLDSNQLSLIISPVGDGLPRLLVRSNGHSIPWLADIDRESTDVLIFAGSYSHQLWKSGGEQPFLPRGSVVSGVVPQVAQSSDLQYVKFLTEGARLPAGKYTTNSMDAAHHAEFIKILESGGLRVHDTLEVDVASVLSKDSLIIISCLMFLLGLVTTISNWALLTFESSTETRIRIVHGARFCQLAIQETLARLPILIAGVVVGFISTVALVNLIGNSSVSIMDLAFTGVASMGSVLILMVMSISATLSILGYMKWRKIIA